MLCSGCGNDNAPESTTTTAGTTVTTTVSSSVTSSAEALENEKEEDKKEPKKELVVAINSSTNAYTPFNITTEYDKTVSALTEVTLLTRDRSGSPVLLGVTGEKRSYNGNSYEYKGIADVSVTYKNGVSVYDITLGDNIKFSDGEKLDADDLIFTLYMLSDPSYGGNNKLKESGIVGLSEYRMNSSIADEITEAEIEEALGTDVVKEEIFEKITLPVIKAEFEKVKTLYGDSSYDAYTSAYPEPKDLLSFFYKIDSKYDSTKITDENEVVMDIAEMYGTNCALLGSMVSGDSGIYDRQARALAVSYITQSRGADENISSISGITKTGEMSVRIEAKGKSDELLGILADTIIVPLHHYGDESLYDYENEKFGFLKGNTDSIIKEKTGSVLSAGTYKFVKSENGEAFFEANSHYYGGVPNIPELRITTVTEDLAEETVSEGLADISFPSGSLDSLAEIEEANKAIEKLMLSAGDSDGYGYIGLNAATINVNGKIYSDQSIYLRKAIAMVIAYYRDGSASGYYGENGKDTVFPVISGVTVDTSEADIPYTHDVWGSQIYKDDMSKEKRLDALKANCLEYLYYAGYDTTGGKVNSAPYGSKTKFTAVIAGGGEGMHPAYQALSDASELLSELGITIEIKDVSDPAVLYDMIKSGNHEIWAGAWSDDVRTMYSKTGDNYYGMSDGELESCIEVTETSDNAAKLNEAYNKIFYLVTDEWAVEVPIYVKREVTLYSTLRVDISSVPADTTVYYSFLNEAGKLKLKG